MLSRLKAVLPSRWFPDTTPVLDGMLTGLASASAASYGLLTGVRLAARIGTATGGFLDISRRISSARALPAAQARATPPSGFASRASCCASAAPGPR